MASRVRTIFVKELRETFRDRRVILGVIISPLLITPLLMIALGGFAYRKEKAGRAEVLHVGVVGGADLPALAPQLAAIGTLRVETIADRAQGEAAVRNHQARAVVVVPPQAAEALGRGETATVEILFDSADEKSRNARERLESALTKLRDAEVEHRLGERGLAPTLLKPVRIEARNLASAQKQGGFLLGIILPYIVILGAAFGGMTSAFDICAGEKERGTMETLLVSPASRDEIILGKLGTICVVSIISAFCSVLGLLLAIVQGSALVDFRSAGISISYTSVAAMLLIVVPLALMTSSLLLVISTFARNQKEAQAWVFPFMILVLLPALLSFVLGPESSRWLSLVPVLNTVLAMKQVLSGTLDVPFLVLALVTSVAYAMAAMRIVVAMFQRESVLFRT